MGNTKSAVAQFAVVSDVRTRSRTDQDEELGTEVEEDKEAVGPEAVRV